MKILFIDNFPINFGVSYIATMLRLAGHEVELMDFQLSKWKGLDLYRDPSKYFSFDEISDTALKKKPDIIGFSVFSPNYMFYKCTAEAIRKRSKIPILVGGVLPTLKPELFMENTCCDFLFRGEGEPVIVELVEKIVAGKYHDMPNLVYRGEDGKIVYNEMSSLVEDLDEIPFYDKSLYSNSSDILLVLTSRGCVLACSYCSAGDFSKITVKPGSGVVRKRKVDCVIEEIKQALLVKSYNQIYFYDDFFITTTKWMSEFAERYSKEIGLPYYCEAFPATVTKDIACLLAKSGCKSVFMGFQTANDEYKKTVLKRRETKELVRKAKANLDAFGVHCALDHIFNFPGETREHIEESLNYYIENKIYSLNIFFLNYFPESGITQYAYDNGFLSQETYQKILKNEIMGEQSFKGTILNEDLANEQVRYAFLFRLINWLPGKLIKWIFKNKFERFLPTNRFLYYFVSMMTELKGKGRGLGYLLLILHLSFAKQKKSQLPHNGSLDSIPVKREGVAST